MKTGMKTWQKWYLAVGVVILALAIYIGVQAKSMRVEAEKREHEQAQQGQQYPQVGVGKTTLVGIPDEATGDTVDDFDGNYAANEPLYKLLSTQCTLNSLKGTKASVQWFGSCVPKADEELPTSGGKLVYAGMLDGKEVFAADGVTGTPYVVVFNASDVVRAVQNLQTLQPDVKLAGYCELVANTAETTKKSVRWDLTPNTKFQQEIDAMQNSKKSAEKLSNGADPMYPCGVYRELTQVAGTTTYVYVRNLKDGGGNPGFYVDIQGVKIVK